MTNHRFADLLLVESRESPRARAHRLLGRVLPSYLRPPGDNADGFVPYVTGAERAGMDVNDWEERELGWVPALPILSELVFPYLGPGSSVLEVGVGTGRWSRHIADRVPDGRLLLMDRSRWIVSFVQRYFSDRENVHAVRATAEAVPTARDEWADLCFTQGMFVVFKLGHIVRALREFSRVLRPGGIAVFDFIDPETPAGWDFLEKNVQVSHEVFTYHTVSAIVRACNAAGLEHEGTQVVGKSTYLVARKV